MKLDNCHLEYCWLYIGNIASAKGVLGSETKAECVCVLRTLPILARGDQLYVCDLWRFLFCKHTLRFGKTKYIGE